MRAPASAVTLAAHRSDLPSIDADAESPLDAEGRWHLAVVGGLDAGAQIDLPALRPPITVGRGPDNLVRLDHPTVSRRHLSLAATPADVRLTDLGARNGTRVAGRPAGAGTSIGLDDVIRVGAVAVEIRRGPSPLPRRTSPTAGETPARLFNRPPRSVALSDPPLLDPHPLDAPDRRAPHAPRGAGISVTMLLGPVAFGAVLAMLFSPLMAVFALMGPALMIGSWAERRWHDRRDRRRSTGIRHLSTTAFAGEARHRHGVERAARRLAQPDPTSLRRWADGGSRLWERRPHDHDAFWLSVGLTDHPWVPWPDAEGPLDSSTASVLGALGPLVDTPVAVALGPGRAIGVVGPTAARDAVTRWLVCQIATLHGPADLRIRLLAPHDTRPAWAFVERLPHAHGNRSDRDGPAAAAPLDLVVVPDASSGALIEPLARLLSSEQPDRSALVAVEALDQLPSWCTTVVELVEGDGRASVHTPGSGAIVDRVLATGLTLSTADSWACALARHRDPEVTSASDGLPDRIATEQLVGPSTPAVIVERWDRSRRRPGDVPAPLGVTVAPSATGPEPFTIDLIADGPHALIGGTTGAGKSELLRTMVLSLALHHPPDAVSFLLVDYKGGSAFDACVDLPHTVGLVTDLDPHLASRALVALDAEIRRRERVLRHARVADLTTGAVPSLARLVVVIDEFATLAAELPGFLDALVDVAQRGRSLGVHLVLATQRPHGAINERIRSNTNLRIALRMLDRAESSDVIDDPAAARLPRDRPGRAFARFGHDDLVQFQTALTEPARLRELVGQIQAAATMTDVGRPTAPWLPPLPPTLSLEALEALEAPDPGDDPDGARALSVPLALADEPERQRQRVWSWHPGRGNLLVYGMPGSGTTTTLISVGLTISRRPDRHRFHLYGVADGSGQLRLLQELAEVGTIVGADDVRRQARLVRMLVEELDRRRASVDADAPIVVVLIDDLPGLLRRFDTIEGHPVVDAVHRVFRDGPVVGLHLVVSGDRPGAIPAALAARTTERLVLHLADPFDRASLGLRPPGRPGVAGGTWVPGHGVVGQGVGTEVQVARCPDPVTEARLLAGRSHRDDICDVAVSSPSAIGELPTRVEVADLSRSLARPPTGGRQTLDLSIGIGDHDLRTKGFELTTGDHALIVGPARSGRSTALAVLARSVLAPSVLGPAGCVIALTPKPSPLRAWPGITVVADIDSLLAAVACSGEAEAILVLVDDCEVVDDPGGALAALLETSRPGLHLVAAGRADRLRTAYGHWTTALRAGGRGLALHPDLDRDGDLWGIRLPRDTASRQCVGRGFLVLDGTTEVVQVATLEPHSETPDGPAA